MMQAGLRVVVGFTLVVLFASPVSAQDERRFGFLFAYPGSVGVQWDASEKLALRLDADYFQSTFTTALGIGFSGRTVSTTTTTTTIGIATLGISPLFTLQARDSLRLYAGPRVAISANNTSSTTESDAGDPPPGIGVIGLAEIEDERSQTVYELQIGGVFGALYRLSDRFGVFAETGFTVRRGTITSSRGFESTQTSFGLRAGVGGILYF